MSTQLSVRLRPHRLDDFLGQPAATAYVRGMARLHSAPNLIVISGPKGTGKTTLARIIGSRLTGWRDNPDNDPNQREVPANVERSIDDVRALIQFARYLPTSGGTRRIIVVDEAHGYVGPAASALLKATEDPPPHVTWIFCTNLPWKLNPALLDRAQRIALDLVADADLRAILVAGIRHARLRLGARGPDIVRRIVTAAHGTPRVAVQMLETAHTAIAGGASASEALRLALQSGADADGTDAALPYLSALLKGDARGAVQALGNASGDGVLEVVTGMLGGLVRRAAGGTPRDGLGWVAVRQVRHERSLADLLELQTRVVAAIAARASSDYAVPADAVLFSLARTFMR